MQSGEELNLKGKAGEELIQKFAENSFFIDWCFPNLKRPEDNQNELCDLLVVFNDVAIVWQIKTLELDVNGKYKEGKIQKNLRQLIGAKRHLMDLKTPIYLENSRRKRELFDPSKIKKVYLISAFAGEEEAFYSSAEIIKENKIHLFPKRFCEILTTELDTIKDFCRFLDEKEKLFDKNKVIFTQGGLEEMLAFYFRDNLSLNAFIQADVVINEGGCWDYFTSTEIYKKIKEQNRISYEWDSIIDYLHLSVMPGYEPIARELALMNRYQRVKLAEVLLGTYERAEKNVYARDALALDDINTSFCFLVTEDPRERRTHHLMHMTHVTKGLFKQNSKVIGIATEKKSFESVRSYDFFINNYESWDQEDELLFEELHNKAGIFKSRAPQLKLTKKYL